MRPPPEGRLAGRETKPHGDAPSHPTSPSTQCVLVDTGESSEPAAPQPPTIARTEHQGAGSVTRAAVPRGASDIAGVAASHPTGPSLPRTATVERERIAPSLSPAAAPVTLVDESTPREGLLGVPPRDDSTSSNGPPKSSEQLDAPAMRSGRPQHATTPLGAAPSEWDPGPPPSLDLGWLHVADPRGDDPDAPGNKCSVTGTGSSPLATNHEGRI